MKKLALSVVTMGVIANCALAEDSLLPKGSFIGAKGGVMHEFITDMGNTHASFGINGGYDFSEYRVYGEINHNFETKAGEISYGGYGYENKVTIKMSSNEFISGMDYYLNKMDNIRLFVGGFVGFESRETKAEYSGAVGGYGFGWSGSGSDTALMLGARFGGIYPIDKNSDIEFGARIDKPFYSGDGITKLGAFAGYTYKF